ncbi:MAG TPA: hypothetical protein ENN47_09170 [Mesotoga infera]|uniref:Uncharacterized protein n=1 Tax=Mesotoga infera TaxID=1236046 RepID=A0A7C1CZH8_9BACT|nr:hypothetical protein [Mesotoga infera]
MDYPVKTRVRFVLNGESVDSIVLERGQTAFIDLLIESCDGEEWAQAHGTISASIVYFDGKSFEEIAVCPIENDRVALEADLPVGTYYLQATVALSSPVVLQRVQRLKLKIVVDRE